MKKNKKSGWHEVIRVASPMFLATSRHDACRYETADGKPLAPGYYLALWPSGVNHSSYGRELRYFGPFGTQAEARLLQTSALVLNIVEIAAPAPVPAAHDKGFGQPSSPAGAYLGGVPTVPRETSSHYGACA